MARDRQRAKQRKARRAAQNPGPAPSEPHRANVPGELEHSSGQVDEFEAALVAGAGGRPGDPDEDLTDGGPTATDDADMGVAEDELFAEDEDEEGALVEEAVAAAPPARRGAEPAAGARGEAAPGGPARLMAFLRASWAELQRVQWPDRRQVFQATAVVLGFVVVAGLYLGIADLVAQEVVDFII